MNDSRYGASKRLHDEMERHDRGFLLFMVGLLVTVVTVLGVGVWAIWEYVL